MTTVQQVYEGMQRLAPPELAEHWDNPGLLGDTGRWPEGAGYAAWQRAKLPRMRLGVPDGSALAAEMDAILKEGN